MKEKKPKGKTPSLIGGTLGKPRKCVTHRSSGCNRCKSPIPKDTGCFEIPQLGGAFTSYPRYCNDCFQAILKKTKSDLDELFDQ